MSTSILQQQISSVHIEIVPNQYIRSYRKFGTDEYWKDLEAEYLKWIKEFEFFLRDHRSQDVNGMFVIKEYEYQCPFCRHRHEIDMYHPDCCEQAQATWDPEMAKFLEEEKAR